MAEFPKYKMTLSEEHQRPPPEVLFVPFRLFWVPCVKRSGRPRYFYTLQMLIFSYTCTLYGVLRGTEGKTGFGW